MTNSEESVRRATNLLQHIRRIVDESPWSPTIDAIIQKELDRLQQSPVPSSVRQLLDLVAHVLQQMYARLPNVGRRLGEPQARDEAAHLLASCFPGTGATGLDAAMLTAMDDDSPGMEVVYNRLAEVLKERMRRAHVEWVFGRTLDPADWQVNLAIVELLLGQLRARMPEEAPNLPPEAFLDCIPDLFFAVQNIENSTLSVLLDRFLQRP